MHTTVRLATITDIEPMTTLWMELCEELRPQCPYPDNAGLHGAIDFAICCTRGMVEPAVRGVFWAFVAEVGDTPTDTHVVGFLAGEIMRRSVGEPKIYGAPHWLYIRPPYRAMGLGRALTHMGFSVLQELKVPVCELVSVLGDTQWLDRGWHPYSVRYMLPTNEAVAKSVPRPSLSNGHAIPATMETDE